MHGVAGARSGSCVSTGKRKGCFFPETWFFVQSVGRVDLPGGNAALLARSLEKLMGLDVRLLCPGHGPMLEGRGAVKENFYLIRQYFFGPQV